MCVTIPASFSLICPSRFKGQDHKGQGQRSKKKDCHFSHVRVITLRYQGENGTEAQ